MRAPSRPPGAPTSRCSSLLPPRGQQKPGVSESLCSHCTQSLHGPQPPGRGAFASCLRDSHRALKQTRPETNYHHLVWSQQNRYMVKVHCAHRGRNFESLPVPGPSRRSSLRIAAYHVCFTSESPDKHFFVCQCPLPSPRDSEPDIMSCVDGFRDAVTTVDHFKFKKFFPAGCTGPCA
jgi:hypothetical protein